MSHSLSAEHQQEPGSGHSPQQQSLIPLWLREGSMCLYSDWSICGTCSWRTKSISSGSKQTPNPVPRCGRPATKPAHGLPSWFSWRLFQRPAARRPSHFLQALNHGQSHRRCSRQHRAPAERSAPCSASSCTHRQDERPPYGHALQDAAKPAPPGSPGPAPCVPVAPAASSTPAALEPPPSQRVRVLVLCRHSGLCCRQRAGPAEARVRTLCRAVPGVPHALQHPGTIARASGESPTPGPPCASRGWCKQQLA